MRTIELPDCTVTLNDDQATKDAVYEHVVKFMVKTQCFGGESMSQCDAPQIEAIPMLSDLIDDILQPKTSWKQS